MEQEAISNAIEQSKRESGGAGGGPNTISPQERFTEQDVTDLMALGYPRSDVLTVLRLCGGNKQAARSVLLHRNDAASGSELS